ncbi:hypothetical protein [Amycolatopsis sp. cmx-4-54]|uniref:hypothetical protein n=1 Tax=Amycolatopsis sp. cmx-4-54 TaxID=2790936 RepID=UPI003978A3DE
MSEAPRKPGEQPLVPAKKSQGGRPTNELPKLLNLTDVREVAFLCATVGGLIRKVFGSYRRFYAIAEDKKLPISSALQKNLSRAVLPEFNEIELVVECCVRAEAGVTKEAVLPDLRRLYDDAVRATKAKKTGTPVPAVAEVSPYRRLDGRRDRAGSGGDGQAALRGSSRGTSATRSAVVRTSGHGGDAADGGRRRDCMSMAARVRDLRAECA